MALVNIFVNVVLHKLHKQLDQSVKPYHFLAENIRESVWFSQFVYNAYLERIQAILLDSISRRFVDKVKDHCSNPSLAEVYHTWMTSAIVPWMVLEVKSFTIAPVAFLDSSELIAFKLCLVGNESDETRVSSGCSVYSTDFLISVLLSVSSFRVAI